MTKGAQKDVCSERTVFFWQDHNLCLSDDSWLKRKGNKDDALSEERMTLGHHAFALATHNLRSPRHLTADGGDASKDLQTTTEMLLISKEHVKALERQVLLANLEKDRTKALLKQQLDMHERSVAAMKLQKRRFAEELKSIMEAIAIQDNFVTSICHGIQGFDKRGDFDCPSMLRQIKL